jgi:ubiquitin-protein ligase
VARQRVLRREDESEAMPWPASDDEEKQESSTLIDLDAFALIQPATFHSPFDFWATEFEFPLVDELQAHAKRARDAEDKNNNWFAASEEGASAAKRARHDDDEAADPPTEPSPAGATSAATLVPLDAPFKALDVAPSDHLMHGTPAAFVGPALRSVGKEWQILDECLPERVYFRAYSDRMDLQRFLIIGAPGTCYYNACFLFDMQLAADHPRAPPRVLFHTLGPQLHAYLHPDGKVCLSLLGTIPTDNPSEKWRPNQSTLLQIVASIQGLILGETNPPTGDARCFLCTLGAHIKLINQPPAEFEAVIRGHFKRVCRELHDVVSFIAKGAPAVPPDVLANYGLDGASRDIARCRGIALKKLPDLETAIALHGAPW